MVSHLRDRQVHDLAQITLISDWQSIAECTSPDEVVDAIQGAQGVFGIALGLVWQEVEGGLAELHGNPYLYEEISYASEEIPNEAIR